jgi:hypothetical protein
MSILDRMFKRSHPSDNGLYLRVRCQRCDEVVQTRVNLGADVSQTEDSDQYFVRKVLIGQRCYRPIEVRVRFSDLRGTIVDREISGGVFVD